MLWIEKPYLKVACISDPHAHFKTLEALISKIPADYKIILLGDLINKGKAAKEVVELSKKYDALIGNHDQNMTVESNPNYWKHYESHWMYNNFGKDTIKSYGDKYRISRYPEFKKRFHNDVVYLKTLPMVIELPNLKVNDKPVILSHSSIREAVAYYGSVEKLKEVLLAKTRTEVLGDYADKEENTDRSILQSIMWSYVKKVDDLPDLGIFNVVGHSVQEDGVQIGPNGALIDCGVYLHNKMSALLLPDMTIIEQDKILDTKGN